VNALTVGSGPNRLLRSALAVLALAVSLVELHALLVGYPWGVDIAIPLQAATRWLAGGQPYLASAFLAGPGYDAPFLYPPFVLPILAPLTHLPQLAVTEAWFVLSLGGAVFACRRLAIPWLMIPLFLVWPPFAEGLLGGNVQVLVFAAFVGLFWRAPTPSNDQLPFAPSEEDLLNLDRLGSSERLTKGLQAIAVGALKAAQVQPWLYLLRRNWRSAVMGAAVLAALGLATLPLVGIGAWLDWLAQLGRANDPVWILAGDGIARSLPWWTGDLLLLGSMVLVLIVPSRHAGAWVGVLAVVGMPGLRVFGLLFALPALFLIRREIALIAGLLMATYTFEGWWLALALVTGAMLLGRRLPWLLEPRAEIEDRPPAAGVEAAEPRPTPA
jgi:hypothetical protein